MNPDEPVDVVDQEGNFLRNTTKREAHEQGLLHKTSLGAVIDSKGRWLLVKQSSDRQDAGQYVNPIGGHVQAGESEDVALRREAEEEIGLQGEFNFEFVGKAIFERHVIGRHENHLFIMYKIYSDVEPVLNNESESFRCFTVEELKNGLRDTPEIFGAAFHFVVEKFFPEFLS